MQKKWILLMITDGPREEILSQSEITDGQGGQADAR